MLFALAAGCQARPRAAASASAPHAITALTDQTLVYTCSDCGMDYDGPGKCTMDGTQLVMTRVSYICPADGGGVARAGKCPRCAANAQVIKTAVAAEAPSGGADTKAPGAASPGTPNGS